MSDLGAFLLLIVGLLVGLIAGVIIAGFVPVAQQALDRLRSRSAVEREIQVALQSLYDMINQMAITRELQARLHLAAQAFQRLGWGRVVIALVDDALVVAEPPGQADKDRWVRWASYTPETLDRRRIGPAYYFPTGDPTQWSPGDRLVMPVYVSSGDLAALVELAAPADGRSPTSETARLLGILASHIRANIENDQLWRDLTRTTQESQQQIEELVMMQRVDQELSATLNFDNVMMLTLDWAVRRTEATAGVVSVCTRDGTALYPVATLGYPPDITQEYNLHSPLPMSMGVVGRAARTAQLQVIADVSGDPDYMPLIETTRSEIAVPMEMRGRVLGVLSLESDELNGFNDSQVSFIRRLAGRAVVAMDNARLYSEAEGQADEMAALYSAGRSISSSLERGEVQTNTAQAVAAVLNVSSALVADYRADRSQLTVTAVYRLGTARGASEVLPEVGTILDLTTLPELLAAIRGQRVLAVQSSEPDLPAGLLALLALFKCESLLMAPLAVRDQILGVSIAIEGRRSRAFTQDDMLVIESLASQAASAHRQAHLYEDVRELENMKSEMIRMASHDLRNPLGNVMGYFDLFVGILTEPLSPKAQDYVNAVRHSTNVMKSLIEDLLTLERIESERQASWKAVDFGELVYNVVEAQRSSADLKRQTLTLSVAPDAPYMVFGSSTQLRQAVTNLVSNAVKYTRDEGSVLVRLTRQDKRLMLEVRDNGYGISKERQGRLFQRFYRAREPVTEHIPGTGLGLSLVKTVVERHGGQVWVESELGKGSTFGFWLPLADPSALAESLAQKLAQESKA